MKAQKESTEAVPGQAEVTMRGLYGSGSEGIDDVREEERLIMHRGECPALCRHEKPLYPAVFSHILCTFAATNTNLFL